MSDDTETSRVEVIDTVDNPEQTWIAHVVNGEVKARIKSEDWATYSKENGI